MLLRELPPKFGSPGRIGMEYLMATTSSSRRDRRNAPSISSARPSAYPLAVSTKLPPRRRLRSGTPDLPPVPLGLVWWAAHENTRIRVLAETARRLLGCTRNA
jgi:hypothetical protein